MGKLRSNRVKRVPQTGITTDRYQYLGLEQAEPNLGDPKVGPSSTGANPIPVGQVFQPVSVDQNPGERFWTPLVGFGTTVGVISVYENGFLPGGNNLFQKIHGLNFVGTGVTVDVPPLEGPFEGVGIATIRITNNQLLNQGKVGQVIYNTPTGYVYGAPDFYYDPSSSNVGIGSTQPQVKLDVYGDVKVSGASTFGGIIELNSGLKDINDQLGSTTTVLSSTGIGVSWKDQSKLSVGYANSSGISTYATSAGYATTAGISTNIKGGDIGSIPYQSSPGITTFLAASIVDGYILEYDTGTNKPQWISPSSLTISYATTAGYAITAGFSTSAGYATTAGFSTSAGYATTAGFSTSAGYATTAGFSTSAGYATTAGIATNIKGGFAGAVVYQTGVNSTGFVTTLNATNKFLQFDGTSPVWTDLNTAGITSISVSADTANTSRYLTFVDVTSGLTTVRTNSNLVYNPSSGNLGIGTTSLTSKLDVFGNITVGTAETTVGRIERRNNNSLLSLGGGDGVVATSGANIELYGAEHSKHAGKAFYDANVHTFRELDISPTTYAFISSTTSYFNNNVGIGITNPGYLLDVNGTIRLRGELRDFNNVVGSAGSVLVSTGAGVSWAAPSSVGGSGGTGVDLYEETTKVGSATSIRFVSQNLTVSAASSIGIVTFTDNPTFETVTAFRYLPSFNTNIFIGPLAGACCTYSLVTNSNNVIIGNSAGTLNGAPGNVFMGTKAGAWIASACSSNNVLIGHYSGTGSPNSGAGTTSVDNVFLGAYAGRCTSNSCCNVFIGRSSGLNISSGANNIFFGQCAGFGNATGSNNIFIGEKAGRTSTSVSNNIFIGQYSGLNNNTGNNNIFIGRGSGFQNTIGCNNIAIGASTGYGATTGCFNNFFGAYSGLLNSGSFNNFYGRCAGYNNTGDNNNFFGDSAGFNNTTGINNTFIGDCAGYNNKAGSDNTFIGERAGYGTDVGIGTGIFNTIIGKQAGYSLIDGNNNVILGARAGFGISNGVSNTIIGFRAGFNLTNANNNTIIGREAGCNLSTGVRNALFGLGVGVSLTSGSTNIAIGDETFNSATTGNNNVVLGSRAANSLTSGENNIIIGVSAGQNVSTGSSNIIIGNDAGTNTGRNNITISPVGQGSTLTSLAGISSAIVIGNTGITSFFTKMAAKAFANTTVKWNSSTYELAADTSSQRFKTDIKPYSRGIDELIKLQSVSYKPIENPEERDQVGLIAEQVNEVGLTEFVNYDKDEAPLSLSYDRMIALAINAIKDLKNEINELKERINTLENQ